MRGKKRPPAERTRALAIVAVEGVPAAAEQTGIPQNTIYEWLDDPEFVELRERTKEAAAEEWWAIVQQGFRRVAELLKGTEDVQKAATATAIVTDKMLLIRGEATGRMEHRDISNTFDDHELALLRQVVHEAAAEPGAETAVVDPGPGQPTPTDG